jgi:hypothetical protein
MNNVIIIQNQGFPPSVICLVLLSKFVGNLFFEIWLSIILPSNMLDEVYSSVVCNKLDIYVFMDTSK